MKKMSMWSFALMLCCTFFQFNAFAQGGGGAGSGSGYSEDPPPIPPPSIVSSNWINDMNSHNCVVLQDDNETIKLFVVITLGVPNVEGNFPPIHFTADLGGDVISGGPVMDADIQLVEINGFGKVYQAQYAYSFSYNADCPYDGQGEYPFNVDYNFSMTEANGDLYPVANYPSLFPPDLLGKDENGNPIPINPVYAGTKTVCCHDQVGYQRSSGAVQEKLLSASIAQPNPFNDHLMVNYRLEEPTQVSIQLVDLNGRTLIEKTAYENRKGAYQTRIDTAPLNPGFYFCVIKTDSETKMLKVLKTE